MKSAGMIILIAVTGTLQAQVLRLADAQALLFKNNLDVLAAEEEAAKAHNELSEAYTNYFPSLDAGGSYNYLTEQSRLKLTMGPLAPGLPPVVIDKAIGANDKAECALNLTYPFFTGFSRYYAVTGKKEMVAMKRATLDGVKNRALLGLGMLYLQWQLSYKQVDLRRALVEQLETYSKQLTAMREAGTIQQSKVLEARARLELARVDVVTAEYQRDSLGLELKSYLLIKDGSPVPDTASPAFDTLPVPKTPLKTRPELIAFDHATAQVEEMRKALRFRHFPVVSGMAGLRYGRPGLNLGRNAYMGYGLVGVQAQWNLFNGFKTHVQSELLDRQINFIDIERTRQTEYFKRSFELARQQFRNAGERLKATESAYDAARALADDSKNSLFAGTVTNAEYLNTLARLAEAGLLVEQVRTMKKTALLKLMYMAGVKIKF